MKQMETKKYQAHRTINAIEPCMDILGCITAEEIGEET